MTLDSVVADIIRASVTLYRVRYSASESVGVAERCERDLLDLLDTSPRADLSASINPVVLAALALYRAHQHGAHLARARLDLDAAVEHGHRLIAPVPPTRPRWQQDYADTRRI